MFERMGQSMKRCLRKTMGNAPLTSDELLTYHLLIGRRMKGNSERKLEALRKSYIESGDVFANQSSEDPMPVNENAESSTQPRLQSSKEGEGNELNMDYNI